MPPHQNQAIEKRFLISLALTGLILLVEVIGGLWTGSLALLSDAAHVFLDIFALGLSYGALRLSALPADDRHTYGFHRFEVLAALANGVTLAGVAIGIFIEAYHRLQAPEPVKSVELLVIATIGLIVNLIVALVLHEGGHEGGEHEREDLNVQSAFLHVLGDAVSSVGVIVAALIIWRSGWMLADPIMSVLIGLIIIASSWRVTKASLHILVEGVPEGFNLSNVAQAMGSAPGVANVHDLHVWSLCSGHTALSAHIVVADQSLGQAQSLMEELKRRLRSGFGVEHATIQFECAGCGQGRVVCAGDSLRSSQQEAPS
jgi:cobalt-zinc-cadmium efflux system protein